MVAWCKTGWCHRLKIRNGIILLQEVTSGPIGFWYKGTSSTVCDPEGQLVERKYLIKSTCVLTLGKLLWPFCCLRTGVWRLIPLVFTLNPGLNPCFVACFPPTALRLLVLPEVLHPGSDPLLCLCSALLIKGHNLSFGWTQWELWEKCCG